MEKEIPYIETKIENAFGMTFRVHTPNLFKELWECSGMRIYGKVMRIFLALLNDVAQRATEINDPVLNALMLKLRLYEVVSKCDDCGKEHAKLAEWLSELNGYKDKTKIEPDFLLRNGFEKRTFDFLYCDDAVEILRSVSTTRQAFGALRLHTSIAATLRRSTFARSGNSECSSQLRDLTKLQQFKS